MFAGMFYDQTQMFAGERVCFMHFSIDSIKMNVKVFS